MGYNYWEKNITNPTASQINDAFVNQQSWSTTVANLLNGVTSAGSFGANGSAAIYLTDAVVTKSAGNDGIATASDPLSYKLDHDSSISPRLLLVGALSTSGSSKTRSTYSNFAGNDYNVQSRFLMA